MPTKLLRIAISFVVVLTAYMVYALAAVPFIEPAVGPIADGPSVEWEKQGSTTQSYHALLQRCFPQDSWVLKNPKVLETDHGMLLIKDYESISAESLEIKPFAMVFFPNAEVRTNPARAGEAIVLEAPRAVLEFDRALDLGRGKIGNLKSGALSGPITIRSDQKLPTPEDDLLITTTDIQLREDRIFTPEPVDFRFGPNFGAGRELVMRFLPKDNSGGGRRGPNIGGLHTIELVRDVRMQFHLDSEGLFAGARGATAAAVQSPPPTVAAAIGHAGLPNAGQPIPGVPNGNAANAAPVRITSQGPFRFDLQDQEATFRHQVVVMRLNVDGQHDQMTCDLLGLQFDPKSEKPKASSAEKGEKPAEKPSLAGDGRRRVPALEPRRMRAEGNPVVIRSPSTGANARCRKLEYDLRTRRITFEDGQRVLLNYRESRIEAPKVSFQPNEPHAIGIVECSGPGWLRTTLGNDAKQAFQVDWARELKIQPHDGRQLISILGQAKLTFDGMGSLAADQIWMWLHEFSAEQVPAAVATRPRDPSKPALPDRLQPDRLVALGNLDIQSPQLVGQPGRLEVWFQGPDQPANVGGFEQVAALPAGAGRGGPEFITAAETNTIRNPDAPVQQFRVWGDLIRMNVVMQGQRPGVRDVSLSGKARIVETRTSKPNEKPLELTGEEIIVRGADTPNAKAEMTGKPARVNARGVSLAGEKIQLDRASNRLWIDGPSETNVEADRDLQGRAVAQPRPVTIYAQEKMEFNGRTITFLGAVDARSDQQRLRTARMDIGIHPPFTFNPSPRDGQGLNGGQSLRDGQPPQLSRIECRGGVDLDNQSYETTGLLPGQTPRLVSRESMHTLDLTVDQLQGTLSATGPGWLKSVRRGNAADLNSVNPAAKPAIPGAAPAAPTTPTPASDGLVFLRLDFRRGATGSTKSRELIFSDQVRGIYGPVRDWTEEIVGNDPRVLGERVMLLSCDQARIAQFEFDRGGQRPPLEFEARGNTIVEGSAFTATADRITYTQAKDLLVLEGTGRKEAELSRQVRVGAPPTRIAARKILYWRATQQVDFEDYKYLNVGENNAIPGLPKR